MNRPITPKQKRCLDWVTEYISDRGYSPSIRDIRDGLGYKSMSTPQNLLVYLRKSGLIGWVEGKQRSLYLINQAMPVVKVDLDTAEVKLNMDLAIALVNAKQRWEGEGLDFEEELQQRLAG